MEKRQDDGDIDFDIRMLELDTAFAYGIPFDDSWYSIPKRAREAMIAGKLGKDWMKMLSEEEVVRKAHK
jgi:hypothetical protein